MKTNINQSRRSFLQNLAALAGSSALLSSYGGLQLIQSAVAAPGDYAGLTDYKSLVCVFLPGGNDAFNTFIPNTNAEYQKYVAVRSSDMAIDHGDLQLITSGSHGFHPALPGLRDLYNNNKLAVVQNVGNLFQPITRDEFFDHTDNHASLNVPSGLFAHDQQQETWQTGLAPEAGTINPGWGGRMIDLLAAANSDLDVPPAFSVAGNNLWQASEIESSRTFGLRNAVPVSIGRFGRFDPSATGTHNDAQRLARSLAWEKIIDELPRTDPLQAQAAKAFRDTRLKSNRLRDAVEQVPTIIAPNNQESGFARQLRVVAHMIAAREALGLKRQTFFVSLGSFDTHGTQIQDHARLLGLLNDALTSFQQTLVDLNVNEDSVTTFTASEFGRSLTRNEDGTDHAWATDYMVMGGAVDGGKMHGDPMEYSNIAEGTHGEERLFGPNDVGSGRFIPAYSTDQYGATLARWMGVTNDDLLSIFPNLGNFAVHDLGFMKS